MTAEDYSAFHDAMQPTLRAARLNDGRFRRTGLTPADADALVPKVLAFAAEPRTNPEAEAWVREHIGEFPEPGVWWAFRQYAPVVHAVTGGPWSFGARPSYRASPSKAEFGDPATALSILVRRYLEGFGPASARDLAQFALLKIPPIRAAFAALGAELVELSGPDGTVLFDIPRGVIPDEDEPAPPRLLGMWDSVLLAYSDRSRIIPADYRTHVIRNNGDVLPTLLVDGYVAGVWRPIDGAIEATAFHGLSDDAWEALDAEARGLLAFLTHRDPAIYRRYGHWWAKLPTGEARVLGR